MDTRALSQCRSSPAGACMARNRGRGTGAASEWFRIEALVFVGWVTSDVLKRHMLAGQSLEQTTLPLSCGCSGVVCTPFNVAHGGCTNMSVFRIGSLVCHEMK
eukprot:673868-Amphidinium_carterae.1